MITIKYQMKHHFSYKFMQEKHELKNLHCNAVQMPKNPDEDYFEH